MNRLEKIKAKLLKSLKKETKPQVKTKRASLSRAEARKSIKYVKERTELIWNVLLYSLPIDIGLLIYFLEISKKTFSTTPYETYIFSLLLLGAILPFFIESVLDLYTSEKTKAKAQLVKLGSILAAGVGILITISIFSEKNKLGEILGQLLTGLAVLGTIFPVLQGLLNAETEDPNSQEKTLVIITTLVPAFCLRAAAALLALQTLFFEKEFSPYLMKWGIVVVIFFLSFPKEEWYEDYFAKRTKDARESSKEL